MILHNTRGKIFTRGKAWSLALCQHNVRASPISKEWESEKNSVKCMLLAWHEQIHLCPPEAVPNHPNQTEMTCMSAMRFRRLGKFTALMENRWLSACSLLEKGSGAHHLGKLCMKPQTYCQCESAHVVVPAVTEKPLGLRTPLLVPSGLCATCYVTLTTDLKSVRPHTLLRNPRLTHLS